MHAIRSSAALFVAALLLATSAPVFARMGPSVLVIYGGSLSKPVFVVVRTAADLATYANFWGGNSYHVVPEQLVERPYFKTAMFWGEWPAPGTTATTEQWLATLKPEQAHQHGRLYVASGTVRAAAVTTAYMQLGPAGAPAGTPMKPLIKPLPQDPADFKYGAWLSAIEIQLARKLGVPIEDAK